MAIKIKDDLIQYVLETNRYTVNKDGTVLSNITGLEVGYCDNPRGYKFITINKDNHHRKIAVHRLVWAVYGDKPITNSLVINHKNGIKNDNRIENLELVTVSENNTHRFRVLKHPAVCGRKKINEDTAKEIRLLRKSGWKYSELCKKFNLCKSTISYIVNNKTWK